VIAAAAALAIALPAQPASAAATPADTASTHAYLQARYELDLALLRNDPAARADTSALVARLDHECHGVLAGAPHRDLETAFGEGRGQPSPRVRGERERALRQRTAIDFELSRTITAAAAQPSRPAIEAFAAATASLSWSDPRIAQLVRKEAILLQQTPSLSPPDVCADMSTWAQSGYRRLAPASKVFAEQFASELEGLEGFEGELSIGSLLHPYEGAPERALARKTEALTDRLATSSGSGGNTYTQLEHALGVPESQLQGQRQAPALGHGLARSGTRFTVRPETSSGGQLGRPCRPAVSIEFAEPQSEGSIISASSGETVCLGRGEPRVPSSTCANGEASIIAAVPASVRKVRLRLSDGSSVTSPVIRIPRKYGGPVGIYAQAIRDAARRPLSLTELNARGRTVQVVRLHAPNCKREPRPIGPKFFKLVQGTAPGGLHFTIEGTLVRFPGHGSSFSVSAQAGAEAFGRDEDSIAVGPLGGASKPSPWHRLMGCPPRSFALVYGILAAPGSSVLARTPEGLVPLAEQQIDPSLHAGGPLFYGAFAALPSELIVRRADGSTLHTESLVAKAKETAEFCEGYAEP
jgi:hypothetical protein